MICRGYSFDGIFLVFADLFCGALCRSLNNVEVGGDQVLPDEEAAAKAESFAVTIRPLRRSATAFSLSSAVCVFRRHLVVMLHRKSHKAVSTGTPLGLFKTKLLIICWQCLSSFTTTPWVTVLIHAVEINIVRFAEKRTLFSNLSMLLN